MTQLDLTPKLGRKRDLTRDPEILEATLDVLAEQGYERMTIDMVAARAKAGKATVYRRWASKADLVIDAVACMKPVETDFSKLPDTGTLRGDLVAMIKTPAVQDGEKKMKIMLGIASMIARYPELAEAAHAAMVAPRAAANRFLMQRAIDRGEISADADLDKLATLSHAMVSYRSLMLGKAVTRDYLVSVIDSVIIPAAKQGVIKA